jgi:hypothetical protein
VGIQPALDLGGRLPGVGEQNSTASKPALAARSKRSRNGTSVNSIVRLAAKRGMAFSCCGPSFQQPGHPPGPGGLRVAAVDVLELVDGLSISVPMAMLVTFSRITSTTTGTR